MKNYLTEAECDFVKVVRDFVDREVRPHAHELERANSYPEILIEQMKGLGLFGLAIPPPYGEFAVSTACMAQVTAEIARGWMSLTGTTGTHSVVASLITRFGTQQQKDKYLPLMATGAVRAALALTEPSGGSDLQAIRTVAVKTGPAYVVNGSKTWITNARRAGVLAVLCKTDPSAAPAHRGISVLLIEQGPGLTVSRDLPKLGYRGIESCELYFDDLEVPADATLGGAEGRGFGQVVSALALGRIHVAARAVGVSQAAYEEARSYAGAREAFGMPIWRHQSVGNYLAEMATQLHASRLLTWDAAQAYDVDPTDDARASMAKLFASEACLDIVTKAMRIYGSYGYSTEHNIERYFRDAPLMIIGEGTNEILKKALAPRLMSDGFGGEL